MKHKSTSNKGHHQLCFRRHIAAPLVLIIQLFKDFIKILNVLVHGFRPAIEFPVKRIKFAIEKLGARGHPHQTLTLKPKGRLQILGIYQTIVFQLDFFQCIVHGVPLRQRISLCFQTIQFVDQIDLLLALLLRTETCRRCQINGWPRGRLHIGKQVIVAHRFTVDVKLRRLLLSRR